MKPYSLKNATKVISAHVKLNKSNINHNYFDTTRCHWGNSQLDYILADIFDDSFKQWHERLTSNKPYNDWTVIEWDPKSSILDSSDYQCIAPTFLDAFAYVIQLIDQARGIPEKVVETDNGIEIYDSNGVMAKIFSVKFESVNENARKKCLMALDKLCIHSGEKVHLNRLKGIKGLDKCKSVPRKYSKGRYEGVDYPGQGAPYQLTSKSLRNALRDVLNAITKDGYTQGETQELLAEILGFESWNHLKSQEKKSVGTIDYPVVLYKEKRNSEDGYVEFETAIAYYSDLASGLVRFGYEMQAQKIKFYSVGDSAPYPRFKSNSIHLKQVDVAVYDEKYSYVANVIIESNDYEASLREYFKVDKSPQDRVTAINKRFGGNEKETLFIKDWVFWISNNIAKEPYIFAEKMSELGKKSRGIVPYGNINKSRIVRGEDGEFWLANDWDEKPVFRLDGLNEKDVSKIEDMFIRYLPSRRYKYRR